MAQSEEKAVIHIGGKQYLVDVGEELLVEKISEKNIKSGKITLDTVLAVFRKDSALDLGSPYTKKTVTASVLDREVKGKKIVVQKYKPKIRYARRIGHRQIYSKIRIDSISN